MATSAFFDDDFKAAVRTAGARARVETLAAGVSVFYRDECRNIDVMEEASGRKFEIRFIHNGPGDENYQVIRELQETAA